MHQPHDSVTFFTGARGSGKSTLMIDHARGFGLVRVWDPKNEIGNALGIVTVRAFPQFVEACAAGLSAAYIPPFPSRALYDVWCKAVWKNGACLCVADELAAVTPIGKAVGWWGMILREGRHEGIDVAAAAQRPAEIDKTIISNSTRILCGRFSRRADRKMMAGELDVDLAAMPRRALQFLDADMLTGNVKRLNIAFR